MLELPAFLELIKILLRCQLIIENIVIIFLRPHIQYETDSEQLQITNGYAEFHAAQEEQGRCHFPR